MTEFCNRLRQCDQQALPETNEFPLSELKTICVECRTELNGLKTEISECKQPGSHGDQLVHFIQWIHEAAEQFEQVEGICEQAQANAAQGVDRANCRQHLLQTFAHLRAHTDRCHNALAQIMRDEKRLDELTNAIRVEPGSAALNRFGLDFAINEWMEKDPDRVRMASAMLVDVDQCGQLNERLGVTITDKILSASLNLLLDVVRKDRGFDRVVQLSGQTFLVFLGDTAMRNAIVGAERVRQNIGAAVFKAKDGNVPVTTSCSVTEWNPSETFDTLLQRLHAAIREAKKAGRNCTVASGPDDVRVVQSARQQVTPREILLR
jgi:diguanylate cyclase (GGDEF)-like protein